MPITAQLTKTPVRYPQVLRPYGSLLYIAGGTLWEGMGLTSDRLVTKPPFEEIHAATLADNQLWVLANSQLATVDLDSGTVEKRTDADLSTWSEELLVLRDQGRVIYTEMTSDDSNLLGHSTIVKLYDVHTGETRMLTKLTGQAHLLGATSDGEGLYVAQIGGDGLGPVLVVQLKDGTATTKIEPEGLTATATLSPGQWLAIVDMRNRVHLHHLVEEGSSPKIIDLPRQPSHAHGLTWGPAGRHLYFVLMPGPWAGHSGEDPVTETHGLWQVTIESGELMEVLPSVPLVHACDCVPLRPLVVSPDGRALLMGAQTVFELVDLQSGATYALDLPGKATILDWHATNAQD
jgi:hypothetical protein